MSYVEHHITATSPAAASTVAGTKELSNLDDFSWFTVAAKLTGATGGTLDVYLQRWVGVLQEWHDWLHFSQLAAGAALIRHAVDCRMSATAATVVGAGTTPVLAVNTLACSHPGTKVRALFTAGASTSAGASQTIVLGCWRV